jgi:hypothetical protein
MLTSNGYVLDPARVGALEPVPEHERHDRDALWERLRRHGYLYLRGHLDPAAVNAFRAFYLDRLGVGTPAELPPDRLRQVLFKEIVPGPEYAAFCTQEAVGGWYAWLLGGAPFLHRRKIIRHVKAGQRGVGTATQAHYDLVYLREGTDQVLSSWIPLGDCPRRRGGLVYLEGSHQVVRAKEAAGLLRHPAASITADLPALAEEYDSRWLVADYASGDMVVHSAYLVHAALDNRDPDGAVRLSTDIRYQSAAQPIDWRWQHDWHDRDGL